MLGGVSVVGKSAQINHGSVGRGEGPRLSFAANTCVRALCGLTFWHAEHVADLPPCVAACVVCVVVANCAVIAEDLL